ncbi:hypothetical protein [Vibrio inusitatus]|uniref:hypothetical protein n=1 Tax=Vibrio inusitatus TaxID=413402 RepID=UPI001FCBD600|nr:hypothetical protein [Vibrio inusitatus]
MCLVKNVGFINLCPISTEQSAVAEISQQQTHHSLTEKPCSLSEKLLSFHQVSMEDLAVALLLIALIGIFTVSHSFKPVRFFALPTGPPPRLYLRLCVFRE